MGLDRFANFISKSINNDGIEELFINNNIRKIIANHIIFDINFLIYQEIIEIENEINDIIKILLCIPSSLYDLNILEELIKKILNQDHWYLYNMNYDLYSIFDGFNEEEIIENFLSHLNQKISTQTYNDKSSIIIKQYFPDSTIIEIIIYEKIINIMFKYINNLHHNDFIISLGIFFDGIPSISKVIEQRRRRIKNFLESNEKKILFKTHFDNLLLTNKNLFECLSTKQIIDINDKKYNNLLFDYSKWMKNRFSIDKSISPSSNFIKNLELFMNIKIKQNFPKKKIFINSANENGESDLKIFKYISSNEINGDYCIHTTDSDLIHQILVQQTYYKIINKDINFTVVKYIKNYSNVKQLNNLGYAQVLDSNLIIKNILL